MAIPSNTHPMIRPLIAELYTQGRPRVWSIIITIFGDAIVPHRHKLHMSELQNFTDCMGFERGTIRTALSRLVSEKWLQRHKNGRNVAFSMTESVDNVVNAASSRIYGCNILPRPDEWTLALFEKNTAEPTNNTYIFNDQCWLIPDRTEVKLPKDAILTVVSGQNLAQKTWLTDQLIPEKITAEYQMLIENIRPMHKYIDEVEKFTPLEALLTRILIIHFWRKVVLKHNPIHLGIVHDNWSGYVCNQMVQDIYKVLLPISEQWWKNDTAHQNRLFLDKRFRTEIPS